MKRILIIRPSAIGDIIMASPVIKTLRKAYPQAYIAWLVEPALMDLLRHNKELDEVICWPKEEWKGLIKRGRFIRLIRKVLHLRNVLRKRRFEIAIDALGLLKGRMLAFLSGAKERISFESKEPGRFLVTKIISRGPNNRFISSEYYYLMQALNITPDEFTMDLVVSQEDQETASMKIRSFNMGDEYAVICSSTTRPQKHWFDERWAQLGTALKKHLGIPVVILGGADYTDVARKIQFLAEDAIFDLSGTTTLGECAAIIKNSSLVIGVDTGLTHMGIALNRPTIALFGATCPYLETGRTNARVMYKKLPCSPCRRSPTCNGEYTCMKLIEVDDVFHTAQSVLESS
ncbi:MAG: glycosyltransferase family 9 protein [Thermodesulfobacteriota bacterium]|nr:glycosyltransferase family 9 protein [Thermodesulfobacteriota bacterium]